MDSARAARARAFFDLHVPGEPLVLYNIWDAGSAKVVAEAGAKALATGSASVAGAQGHDDAESLPIDFAIANLRRITQTVDLPVTLDFEGAYAVDPGEAAANVLRVADAGGVGINFEDQLIGGDGLHSIADQSARISAIRAAVGAEFFINARTDIFLKTGAEGHTRTMIDDAAERVRAYADAGASGFFAPGLKDEGLIAAMVEASPLPVNIMDYPGVPAKHRLAALGVARISHGPFPWRRAMAALAEGAREALA
jgi:2-methylisocitrate lyase-like PEP mutase family enzyme